MPLSKLTCPECSAVLKPSKPVPEGKTIKCPKCSKNFVAGKEPREAIKAKPTAQKPAKNAAAPPPKVDDDDDDGPGIYSVREDPVEAPPPRQKAQHDDDDDDDDDDEDRPETNEEQNKRLARVYQPDDSIKDPRGPAQELVVKPSNLMMLTAMILIGLQLLSLFMWAFPFIFSEHVLEPSDVLKVTNTNPNKKDPKKVEKEWKDLTPAEKNTMEAAIDDETERRLLWMIPGFCGIVYLGVLVMAAYKMQNMESYPWSWVGAVMMMLSGGFAINGLWWLHDFMVDMADDPDSAEVFGWVPIGAVAGWCAMVGVFAMTTLKREKVKTGFYWVPD